MRESDRSEQEYQARLNAWAWEQARSRGWIPNYDRDVVADIEAGMTYWDGHSDPAAITVGVWVGDEQRWMDYYDLRTVVQGLLVATPEVDILW